MLIAVGETQIYTEWDDHPLGRLPVRFILISGVTKTSIYWIHRGLHVSPIYEWIYEPHYRYERPTLGVANV